ncbi:MAG: DEAD/DEAH box helicase family protein [Magnetococcales bacterium]|nr:DEAD/DEAH box helicase family protein [Magnetococcales bacterium]
MIRIAFDLGSLLVSGPVEALQPVDPLLRWDDRTACFRAEARHYGPIVLALHRGKIPYEDQARAFQPQRFEARADHPPRPHQQAAFDAWVKAGSKGVVVLPTGAGKTLIARMAISRIQRDTLILAPTINLVQQWHDQLSQAFGQEIGMLGGGEYQLQPITVSTYDSAYLNMERIGARFGLLVCDECHHLPAATTRQAALMCVAPYRLGLTATPERTDGLEEALFDLLGPLVYRCEIADLEGAYLAPYHLERIPVILDPDERQAYDAAYAHYKDFARSTGVSLSSPAGWSQFIMVCCRSREGRAAMAAYRMQKRLARASRAKLRMVWTLLRRHRRERALLFTDDNATAYAIGETFFLPVITHKTKITERTRLLAGFRAGEFPFLVNSRVLNEGIDLPEVAVGIIVSGSGSIREHVQRLGRLLRPREGKQAILYELVSQDTAETFTSERRRQHSAYQRSGENPC